ncbi:DUF6531 domain-containing protein [Streptomyces radicis]|uniref:RHS repeat protein n=1 Tax=Streptomyces radicis TaxID=1750517 RepID=A0A3A9WR19_9ACTN|nr:DUF6531 domain-containing protein [Streptomyces radicis]RKN11964.1 RHS repeat protein [Streptomyces radicis]RKN25985.1 RHS repeat protein [Streptomyces radicis]
MTDVRDAVIALVTPRVAGDEVGGERAPWHAVSRAWARASAAPEPLPGFDPATGGVDLSAEDVRLPGVLPLVIGRRHRTGGPRGRHFGTAWTSTLDQRLELRADGVRLISEDGTVVDYPVPTGGVAVLPVNGPHWPLRWDGTAGGPMKVTRPGSGMTWHYRPVPGVAGSELPLVEVTDRHGNGVALAHDKGTVMELSHSGGQRVGVVSEAGRVTELRLRGDDDVVLARYTYDEAGDLVRAPGGRLEHDGEHRLTGWEDPTGTTRYRYGWEGDRVVTTEGTDGLLSATIAYDAEAARTTAVTDGLGATTVLAFDERGLLISETDPLGAVTRKEWTAEGRLAAVTDPLGRVTRYGYDERGAVVSVTYADGTRVAAVHDEHGFITSFTAEDGAVCEIARDDRGNPLRETGPGGAVTVRTHDGRGALASVTDALGGLWRVTGDAAGLPVEVTDPTGRTTRYERDARGRVVRVTGPGGTSVAVGWHDSGAPSEVTWADGTGERFHHDAAGHLVEHVDAAGHVTRRAIGPFGVVTRVGRPDGSSLTRSFDAALRVTEVRDGRGTVWTYRYDAAGRLSEETGPGGASVRYRFDAAGQLARRTNGAGQRVSQTHDGRGRLVEQRSDTDIARYRYDPVGRLVGAVGGEASVTRALDATGAVVSESCGERTVRFAYDALGRPVERRTPSGAVTSWTYDAGSFMTGLRAGDREFGFDHDAHGRETSRHLGRPGVTLRQRWDAAGRLVEQVLPGGARRRTFRYREDGFLTRVVDSGAGITELTPDPLGRPLKVNGPGGDEEFGYDADGGPTGAASGYRYDTQGRVVQLGGGELSLSWDAHDRLTDVVSRDGRHVHLVYDALGRRIARQLLDEYGSVVEETALVWAGARPVEEIAPDGTATTWHWTPDGSRPVAQSTAAPGAVPRCHAIVTDPTGTPLELVNGHGGVAWQRRASALGARRTADGKAAGGEAAGGRPGPSCALDGPHALFDAETGLSFHHRPAEDPGQDTGQDTAQDTAQVPAQVPARGPATRPYDPVGGRFLSPAREPGPSPYGVAPPAVPHILLH